MEKPALNKTANSASLSPSWNLQHCFWAVCPPGDYFHRDLLEVGATSYLVAPENLSGRRKTESGEYAQRAFDFEELGNLKALKPSLDMEKNNVSIEPTLASEYSFKKHAISSSATVAD